MAGNLDLPAPALLRTYALPAPTSSPSLTACLPASLLCLYTYTYQPTLPFLCPCHTHCPPPRLGYLPYLHWQATARTLFPFFCHLF